MTSAHTLLALALLAPAAPPDKAGLDFFEKKVRPVLVEHCYPCHSADALARKKLRGGLLLDTRDGLLKGGDSGPALVPGDARASLLIKTLRHDGDIKMPPRQKLPAAVRADLEAWVNRGAPDPRSGAAAKARGMSLEEGRKFWAYRPPAAPSLPDISDRQWARGALDAFLLAAMEAKGLRPAPEADRATLARRLSYDLTGLPPAPEWVDAFVHDKRPGAYERLVDQLLGSPAFGQRWGRHWLDVARYAESLTLRGFVLKDAWRYRDYVIDSFNDDAPFDRFIREQLAGDLLGGSLDERRRGLVATSFLALGNTNLEEQDKKQLRLDVVDEQLDTLGRAFLAQTLGCARCHDHKFDPVPTRDYYALASILRNTRTLTHANVSMWLERPLPADAATEAALKRHEAAVAALQREIKALGGKPGKARAVRAAELPGIVVDDTQAKKVGTWAKSTHSGSYVEAGYLHDGDADKGEKTITFQPAIPKSGKYEVRLAYSAGTNRAPKVPVTIFSADGDTTVHIDQRKAPPIGGLFISLGQHRFETSGQGYVLIENEGTTGHVIADAVVFIPVEQMAGLEKTAGGAGGAKRQQLEAKLKAMTAAGPRREMALSIFEEDRIEETRVHVRGSVHNLGEPAPRGVLRVALSGDAPAMPANQSGRRQLAEWVASERNPLTARVVVNRAWHWLFGAGLVRTVDNFGTTGERPSHPELLDHLAIRFVAEGWSVKRLVREIVLSSAYRQSSVASDRAKAIDPENRLLSHANRRRLEAEAIRDTVLSVSGRLVLDHGGPTYKAGLAADYGYKHTDARRSVYSPLFRNALPELFEVFDVADPSVSTGRRNVSTVAPQALYLMNHPFVREQSRHAAARLLALPGDDDARLTAAYRLALGRPPSAAERRVVLAYLAEAGRGEEGWARVAQVLFASVDFRYVE